MNEPEIIQLHRKRDFGEKLNATFSFVRLNFKPFIMSILQIAGPPILATGLLMSSFYSDLYGLIAQAPQNPDLMQEMFFSLSFWLQIGVMILFMVFSYLAITSVSYNFVRLYDERKGEPISVQDVWARVRETFGMYLGTSVLFTLLVIAMYVVLILPVAVLSAISPVLSVLGIFVLIIGIIYVLITLSLIFPIRAFENVSFIAATQRSFLLIGGKWWSTFGVLFVLSLIAGVTSYIFSLPAAILQGVNMVHTIEDGGGQAPGGAVSVIAFVLQALAYICQLLLYFLPCIGLAFQYFNLVERKESKGLISDIGGLGQPTPKPGKDDQY